MKKNWLAFALTCVMLLSLCACGQSGNGGDAERLAAMETKVAELEAQVQMLNDINEIKLLQERFANLADAKDADTQMELFAEDAELVLNFGGQTMTLHGRDEIYPVFSSTVNGMDVLYHMNGQGTIEVDGDKASGIAYCRVVLIDTEDGITTHTDEGVRYTDEYVREDGKWVIAKRTSDFLFMDSAQTPAEETAAG